MFYALLWALEKEELPAYVEAVSVRTGERFRTVPSGHDVTNVATEVAELATEMRRAWQADAQLPRTGGPWCKYCPILSECPEGQSIDALLN